MGSALRFAFGRIVALFATMLVASFVVYVGTYLAPGSPMAFLTGGRTLPPAAIEAINRQYHLDQPFFEGYYAWLVGALHGSFGTSIIYHVPVNSLIVGRLGITTALVVYAMLLILVWGVGSGVIAGLKGGTTDTAVGLFNSVGLAIPSFVTAILLIFLFSVTLGWFPVYGPGTGGIDRIWHLTLPALALALTTAAFVSRVTRSAIRSELASEHVDAAIIRGIPFRIVARRHVVRNALIPIVTVAGLTAASLIAGSVIIDQAFALGGLGSYLVTAVTQHDYPVVQGITMLLVLAFIVINTLVDATYPLIDPRIQLGRRK
jgi:peptide/nickel transport system permease protein